MSGKPGFSFGATSVSLLLAVLVGLLAGWLIWGRGARRTGPAPPKPGEVPAPPGAAQSAAPEADLAAEPAAAKGGTVPEPPAPEPAPVSEPEQAAAPPIPSAPISVMSMAEAPAVPADPPPPAAPPEDPDTGEGKRPEGLAAPRDGQADDLKRIKGIGPKLEQLCHHLGYFHFDQIAAWTPAEIAWVDQNLDGFRGRVTRDDWVAQARALAAAAPPHPENIDAADRRQ